MLTKTEIFEITQFIVYIAVYNYIYITTSAPFEWFNYYFCFLPVLVVSVPSYLCYFFTRKALLYLIDDKYIAVLTIFLSYALIALFLFHFFSQIIIDKESVVKANSRASLYTPLFILPFLAIECVFDGLRNSR